MPKGQLSRIPWPEDSWMLFTFQAALSVLKQPHKTFSSLQLATHTQQVLAHHYTFNELYLGFFVVVVCFLSPRGFLQSIAWPHQSTETSKH